MGKAYHRTARRFFACALMLVLGCALFAEDWPHPLGPRYDGHFAAADVPAVWPTQGLRVLWDRPIGHGFSGMTVREGMVFTLAQSAMGQELVCLALADGETVWRTRYAFPWEMDGNYPGPFGTPVLDGNRVLFCDCYGVVVCARASDGAILWKFDAVRSLNPEGVDFGYSPSPLVLGGQVILPAPAGDSKTTVFSLDETTGKLLWRSGTNVPSYSSCLPISVGGERQVVAFWRNGIAGYDPKTGEEWWRETWSRGYFEHASWPLYREPLLFCASPFKRGSRVYRLAMVGGRGRAELVWENKALSNDIFSSALLDGHVYGFDVQSQQAEWFGRTRGSLKCLELETGRVMWTNVNVAHCSVTVVGKHLLALEDQGVLRLFAADPTAYRELARAELPKRGKYWTAPVVIGNRLLVRSQETIACYDLSGAHGDVPRVASREPRGRTAAESVAGWFARHRSSAFVSPMKADLFEWYLCGLVLTVASSCISLFAKDNRVRAWIAIGASFVLGLVGTFLATQLRGHFVFTGAVSLHGALAGLLYASLDATGREAVARRSRPWVQWACLAAFLGCCLAHYWLCARVFFTAGWGFLTGFPFAFGPTCWWAREARGRARWPRLVLLSVAGFSAFVGGAGVVLWIRTLD